MSVEAVSFETYEEMCSAEAYYINRWRPERNKGIPNRPLVAPVPTTAWHTLWSRDPARVDELDRNDYSGEIQTLKKELTEARQQAADYAVAAHRAQSAYQQLSVRNERSENKLAKVRRIVEYG
jgi:hypothetical protein